MKKIKYLPIINRSGSCKIKVSDICYVARDNRKLLFATEDGDKNTYGKIDEVEEYLGDDFVRCMSGCIVNLTKVKGVMDGIVYFDNGATLKPGHDGYVRIKQRFNAYLRGLIPKESGDDEDNEK